ncbi:MAG: RNA polymerase sigma factor [Acidimicrobiales bacterium]
MGITGSAAVDELDPVVVTRAVRGDDRSFAQLIRHYDRALRSLAYRMLGDRDRMDDVLQEAYVKAYRALPGFRGDARPGTWLYRIVYNACIDELRRSSRRPAVPFDELDDRPSSEPELGDRASLRAALDDALARLTPEHRAVVLLVDAEGFDYPAAAEVLGIAPGTVASRLSRARSFLRAALEETEGGER